MTHAAKPVPAAETDGNWLDLDAAVPVQCAKCQARFEGFNEGQAEDCAADFFGPGDLDLSEKVQQALPDYLLHLS